MNVLNLTLSKAPFIAILEGQKKEEYREDKEYWSCRLEGKEDFYTHILFRNGYSAGAPEILIECKKIQLEYWVYKGGAEDFIWVLKLGKIIEKNNIRPYLKPSEKIRLEQPLSREPYFALIGEEKQKKAKGKAGPKNR